MPLVFNDNGFSINKLNLLLANIIESSICIVVGEHIKADEFLEIDSILLISLVIQVEYFLNFGFNLLLDRLTLMMFLYLVFFYKYFQDAEEQYFHFLLLQNLLIFYF